jgi:zona occludens toxin
MAIMAYTGVMGSGKTYEGVSTAALTALRAGRRVVTNISGFNFEKIRDFLGPLADGGMLEAHKVLVIPSHRLTEPLFFFDPDVVGDTVVRPGDLVLIDEVWSFWGKDAKLTPEHQKFFRMHRHYTEADSGVSCDLVLMIQDLGSLHRFIRGVLETNLKFTKMKSVGMPSRYQVVIFEGGTQRRANIVSTSLKKYDKRIFPLYKSYDAGAGKENVVDGRANMFNNKVFQLAMVLGVIGVLWGAYWFVGYVAKLRNGGVDTEKAPVTAVAGPVQALAPPGSVSPSGGSSMPAVAVSDVRLVGVIESARGESIVILQLGDGRIVNQRMSAGVIDGWQTTAGYQGRMVGFVFGSKAK